MSAAALQQIEAAALDDDIKAALRAEVASGRFLGLASAELEQQKRDRRAALTPVARRRLDYVENEGAIVKKEDIRLVHSIAALCGLPYKAPPADQRIFSRQNGPYSLAVQTGHLMDPNTGKWVEQGIPYGPKARLLFVHICNEAVRTNSAEIEIADSLTGFMKELGLAVTGGAKGSLPQFKEQLARLASCSMLLGYTNGEGRADTSFRKAIEHVSLWLPRKADQPMLWQSTLTLDPQFYDGLRRHALPVDIRALRAVSQSARQMDMVLWLTYRSRQIDKPLGISWAQLQSQFSEKTGNIRSFKQKFAEDVTAVSELFGRRLKIALHEERGLVLYPMEPNGSTPSIDGRGLVPKKRIAEQNSARKPYQSRYAKKPIKTGA